MNGDRGTSHRAANSSGKSPPRETWRFASSSLAVAAVVISLPTLWANDGPRNSTKKMATFESPGKQQTDADAQKSKSIAATVRLPNGNPAVGAAGCALLGVGTGSAHLRLALQHRSEYALRADGAGRFQLTTPSDEFWIAVAHPSGFLRRRFGPNTVPAVIELMPWGRVEGTLRIGRKLQPNTELSIQLEDHDQHGPHDPWFWASHTAKTDAAGHFAFEHVVPGRATVSKSLASGVGRGLPTSSAVYAIEVQAGQTTKIDLGTSGRPVVGQLRVSPNSKVTVDSWVRRDRCFETFPSRTSRDSSRPRSMIGATSASTTCPSAATGCRLLPDQADDSLTSSDSNSRYRRSTRNCRNARSTWASGRSISATHIDGGRPHTRIKTAERSANLRLRPVNFYFRLPLSVGRRQRSTSSG